MCDVLHDFSGHSVCACVMCYMSSLVTVCVCMCDVLHDFSGHSVCACVMCYMTSLVTVCVHV